MKWFDIPPNELQTYCPELTAQPDFEEFWQTRIEESANYPLDIKIEEEIEHPIAQLKVQRISFAGFRNSRIGGLWITPKDGITADSSVVQFHGYNYNSAQPHYGLRHVMEGRGIFLMETRGQNLRSPDHHLYPTGGAAGWLTQGVLDPDNAYYSLVFMDCYRAVEALISLNNNPKLKVIVEGISQGGGLALAAGSLHSNVSVICSDVPFLSHYKRSVQLSTDGPYSEISHFFKIQDSLHILEDQVYKTLSYVDVMNHAHRIKVPTLMSAGQEDTICPPSTVYAIYNHLGGEKEIKLYPDFAHGGFSQHEEERIKFVAQHL